MSENTAISWTDHTFNAWTGCTKVSPGCANCYAEGWAKRSGIVQWGAGKHRRRTSASNWKLPIKWNSKAIEAERSHSDQTALGFDIGVYRRPRVFCASLSDWLDDEVPIKWLADLMRLIVETPNLDWLLLTKRPQNFRSRIHAAFMETACGSLEADNMMSEWEDGNPPSNVWIGTTVEDQQRADERIPELLKIPAKIRFLSCEPLLGPVDLESIPDGDMTAVGAGFILVPDVDGNHVNWVITGGESGPGFRPFNVEWARSLRDQCKAAGVAFHMKQMGGLKPSMMPPIPDDLMIREWPKGGAL